MRSVILIYLIISLFTTCKGQILFPESFTVILDSSKSVKGSVTPELKIQTHKKTLVEITNLADLSVKLK